MEPQAQTPAGALQGDEATHSLARGTEATLPPTPPSDAPGSDSATEAWFKRPAAGGDFIGRTFGDYELVERLGRGGMGVVYKARQRRLNRVVALKMIRSGEFAGDDEIARFYAEAEAAAQLDHPNIVPVFEVGQHQGEHFFSMGYIDGPTLAQRVAQGPLPPREAAELVRELTVGVQYAHDRGVIHRDLKPQNILLASQGQRSTSGQQSSAGSWGSQPASEAAPFTPKITDFGLAKRLQSDSSLTETGAVLGTPSYMPPEQAAGRSEDVGAASDVYSLGAILYCLLTGRPPFQAATMVETVRQVLEQEPVAPRALVASIPLDLETITLKCLQKEPGRRYASAAVLGDDLARYLRGEPILARPVSRVERVVRWCNRNRTVASLISLAVVLLVGGTIVSALFAWDAHLQRAVAVQNADEATDNARKWREQERLATSNAGLAKAAAGRAEQSAQAATQSAAFARKNQYFADVNLAQQVLAAGDVTQAIDLLDNHIPDAGNEDLRGFEWYYLWSLSHSSSAAISWASEAKAPDRELRAATVSPDGKLLAVAGGRANAGEVRIYDAATRKELRTLPSQKTIVAAIAWSPDSQRLATCSGAFNLPAEIKVFSAATGELAWEAPSADPALALAWSPDGQWIAVGTAKLIEGRGSPPDRFFSTARGAREGGVRLLSAADGSEAAVLPGDTGNVFSVTFSADGETLAAGNERGEVHLFSVKSRERTGEFRSGLRYIWSLACPKEGDLLAAASGFWDEPGEVLLWNLKTQQLQTRLRGHRGGATAVNFAPDGQSLASGSFDRTVRLWNTRDGTELAVFYGQLGYAWNVDFCDEGQTLLAADWRTSSSARDGGAQVTAWNIPAGRSFTPISAVMVQAEHYYQAAAAGDTVAFLVEKGMQIWDGPTATLRHTVKSSGAGFRTCDVSPDGKLVAGGGFAPTTRIFDAHSGAMVAELETLTVPFLVFSPDGGTLATCGDDGVVRLWEAASGQPLHALTGHTDVVWSATFTPDGKRVATGSWDGTVRLWDTETGRALGSFAGHREALWRVEFVDNGRTLLSRGGSSGGDNLGVWDVSHVMPAASSMGQPEGGSPADSLYTSRPHLTASSYAFLGHARESAGDLPGAEEAYARLQQIVQRQLEQMPLIHGYSESEIAYVHETLQTLLKAKRWQDAAEIARLSVETCQRQIAATPESAYFLRLEATAHLHWSQAASGLGNTQEFLEHVQAARERFARLAEAAPADASLQATLAQSENGFAWSVALQPDAPRELIDQAVEMARACTGRAPTQGIYWNTLGVVLLRAEQWDEAVAALQKSCELRSGGDAYDWYPLAVALKHQGKLDEAQAMYDRAEGWRKNNSDPDADLSRLRDQAAAEFSEPK